MTDTPQDAERLAEIRSRTRQNVWNAGLFSHDEMRMALRLLDARDARIAEFESGRAYRDSLEQRDRLTADLAQAEAALDLFVGFGCPVCHGDCASANPPVACCPMQAAHAVRHRRAAPAAAEPERAK